MKRALNVALGIGLLCGILATWLGPKAITYWYSPPLPPGATNAFNCTPYVSWAMTRLVETQVIGTLVGLVLGAILGMLIGRRKHPAAQPSTPQVPAAAPQATALKQP